MSTINLELNIVKGNLPAATKDWTKCFIQIVVDGSASTVKTSSTKHPGQHEWHEQLLLPTKGPESVLRFELRRKNKISFVASPKLLAYVEISVSELLNTQHKSGQDEDILLHLHPTPNVPHDCLQSTEAWQLFLQVKAHSGIPQVTFPHVSDSVAEIVVKLESFMQVGDAVAQIHPYIFVAWKTATALYTIIKGQVDLDGRLDELGSLMIDSYAFLEDIKSFSERISPLEETIQKLLSQTTECAMFIRECSGYGFGKRLISTAWLEQKISQFQRSFTSLKQALELGVTVQAGIVCFRIDETLKDLVTIQNLMKLNPADMDDPLRPECLPMTRIDIISEVFEWACTPVKHNIFWLHGFPGAGKSAIATSISNHFRSLRRLGAFVFFTRGVAARSDPTLVIRTIAYQLGEFDPRIRSAISSAIEETPSIKQAPLRFQFQRLLVKPLMSSPDFQRGGPILVVIDALDECGCYGSREELLRILIAESCFLPPTVRIFITSRAEKDIHSVFSAHTHILERQLDITSPTNEVDVRTYIRHRMVDICAKNKYLGLPLDWPGASRVSALALRASGLFVWASTACRYVESGQDPEERLALLLKSKVHTDSESALDNIYVTALESAGKWDDPGFTADFRDILGIVIVAEDPLTAQAIDILNADFTYTRKKRPSLHTLQHLGCVLQWAGDRPIRVMHPSFADFITERRRCGRDAWYIDKFYHELRVARQCIRHLNTVLKKNVCNLTLTMTFEPQKLPEHIAYSCIRWISHLCKVPCSEASLGQEINDFLRQHFLHWVEAMVVMGQPRQTITLMDSLKEWISVNFTSNTLLCEFAADADRFCQAYVHVFEQHPLLVYQSALPFTPTASVLYQTFKEDPSIPCVDGFRDHWSPLLSDFGHSGGQSTSISCSPDGRYIVSADTRGISVWDSTTYELITKPSFSVRHVANFVKFSPNSQCVASGYADGSLRLWDAISGKETSPQMLGHSGAVYALVFSKDGSKLVSAGQDKKIIVWDTATATAVHPPLMGHSKTILCLAIMPNKNRLASGSRDWTIRTWDVETGSADLPLMDYHEGAVTALAYSPDGRLLISACDAKRICVSDAETGTLLYLPGTSSVPFILQRHKSAIHSIAISPDGTLLASASKDTTVRLWDLRTGKELAALVRQHRFSLRCVEFMTDGRRIVTASTNEATLRVWDLESTGSMGVTRRHKGLVTSLAFSSDGKYLVSGGKDCRVQVRDMVEEKAVIELVLEYAAYTVGFSPDDSRILAKDEKRAVFAWNKDTLEPLMATPEDTPRQNESAGPLTLKGRWVVNTRTGDLVTLLPNMSPINSRASWGNSIAFGLMNGGVVVLTLLA